MTGKKEEQKSTVQQLLSYLHTIFGNCEVTVRVVDNRIYVLNARTVVYDSDEALYCPNIEEVDNNPDLEPYKKPLKEDKNALSYMG